MSLKAKNKVNPNFNMSSLTDIIFLLLIFFMLTSTLVSPNALKLILPNSNSQTMEKQSLSISITNKLDYFVNRNKIQKENLKQKLSELLVTGEESPTIVLNAEKSVPIDEVVQVMNIARDLEVQLIIATSPVK